MRLSKDVAFAMLGLLLLCPACSKNKGSKASGTKSVEQPANKKLTKKKPTKSKPAMPALPRKPLRCDNLRYKQVCGYWKVDVAKTEGLDPQIKKGGPKSLAEFQKMAPKLEIIIDAGKINTKGPQASVDVRPLKVISKAGDPLEMEVKNKDGSTEKMSFKVVDKNNLVVTTTEANGEIQIWALKRKWHTHRGNPRGPIRTSAMNIEGKRVLLGLVALFVLTRLCILVTSDEITHVTEARQGNLAHYIHTGQEVHIGDFVHQSYEGSCLLDALLVVGAYTITGGSGYSLKLVTFGISFLILLASLAVARRFPGDRSRHLFVLLFTFAPTYFITWHFHSVGGSLYGSLFNVVIFLVALDIVREPTRRLYLLWGFLCAPGIYLNPACLPGLLMSLVVVLLGRRQAVFDEQMRFFAVAFVPPFVFYALLFGIDVPAVQMVKGLFVTRDFIESRQVGYYVEESGVGAKLFTLFAYDLRHSVYYKGFSWYGAPIYLLGTGLFLASVFAARKGWKGMRQGLRGKHDQGPMFAPAVVSLYVILFFVIYLIADIAIYGPPIMIYHDQFYKYFYNVYPFIFLGIAFVMDRVLSRFPKQQVVVWGLSAVIALPAVLSTLSLISPSQFTLRSKFRPYDYKYQGRMLAKRARRNRLPHAIALCKQLDPRNAMDCLQGVAMDCDLRARDDNGVKGRVTKCCANYPVQDRWLCVLGLGNRLLEKYLLHVGRMIDFCTTLGGYADLCIQGYLSEFGDVPYREPQRWLEMFRFRSRDQRARLLRNMGYWVYNYFLFNPKWSFRTCRQVDTRLNSSGCGELLSFHYGIREAVGGKAVHSGVLKLTETHRKSYLQGYGFGYAWRLYPQKTEALRRCLPLKGEPAQVACRQGVLKYHVLVRAHL